MPVQNTYLSLTALMVQERSLIPVPLSESALLYEHLDILHGLRAARLFTVASRRVGHHLDAAKYFPSLPPFQSSIARRYHSNHLKPTSKALYKAIKGSFAALD